MAKLGRPTKLNNKVAAKMFVLSRRGLTQQEIADILEIGADTVSHWLQKPELFAFIKQAKNVADAIVVRSLYERAVGYEFEQEEVLHHKGGDSEVVRVSKRLPPDVVACIFWLKNRQQQDWKDRSEMHHGGDVSLHAFLRGAFERSKDTAFNRMTEPTTNGNGNGHSTPTSA